MFCLRKIDHTSAAVQLVADHGRVGGHDICGDADWVQVDGEGGGGAAGTEEGLCQRHSQREAFSTVPIKELHAVIMCDHKITFHQILSRVYGKEKQN